MPMIKTFLIFVNPPPSAFGLDDISSKHILPKPGLTSASLCVAAGGLPAPFAEGRPLGSALYFMVTPGSPVRLHRIRNDQLYHYYLGDPLEVCLLHADGTTERIIVGPDLRSGQRVQLLIPGNTFHTARLIGRRQWFLGASTEWPGVVPADVEIGDLDELAAKYPAVAADLRAIAASVRQVAPAGEIAGRRYVALAATASISIKKSGP